MKKRSAVHGFLSRSSDLVMRLEEAEAPAVRVRRFISMIRASAITPKVSPAIQIDLRAKIGSGGTTALWGEVAVTDGGGFDGVSTVVAAIGFVVEDGKTSRRTSEAGWVCGAVVEVCCELGVGAGIGEAEATFGSTLFKPPSSVLCPPTFCSTATRGGGWTAVCCGTAVEI